MTESLAGRRPLILAVLAAPAVARAQAARRPLRIIIPFPPSAVRKGATPGGQALVWSHLPGRQVGPPGLKMLSPRTRIAGSGHGGHGTGASDRGGRWRGLGAGTRHRPRQPLGRNGRAQITLVERARTHQWKPLLHAVAAGRMDRGPHELNGLAQTHWHHFTYRFGAMKGLDRQSRVIHLAATLDDDGREITPPTAVPYDTLIMSLGSVGLETNRINQLVVEETLQTTRDTNIFAMGDYASPPFGGTRPGGMQSQGPRLGYFGRRVGGLRRGGAGRDSAACGSAGSIRICASSGSGLRDAASKRCAA